jgi:GTP cyclohydrolase I
MLFSAIYIVDVTAKCPRGDAEDQYKVYIYSDDTILVEEINKAVAEITSAPIYQEDLAKRLAAALQARVVIEGEHSGVKVECIADAAAA